MSVSMPEAIGSTIGSMPERQGRAEGKNKLAERLIAEAIASSALGQERRPDRAALIGIAEVIVSITALIDVDQNHRRPLQFIVTA